MTTELKGPTGTVRIFVHDSGGSKQPIAEASVEIRGPRASTQRPAAGKVPDPARDKGPLISTMTGLDGVVLEAVKPGKYQATVHAFGECITTDDITVVKNQVADVDCAVPVGFEVATYAVDKCEQRRCTDVRQGESVLITASWLKAAGTDYGTTVITDKGTVLGDFTEHETETRIFRDFMLHASGDPGFTNVEVRLTGGSHISNYQSLKVLPFVLPVGGELDISLQRTASAATDDLALWTAILNGTEALSFNVYQRFMNNLFCGEDDLHGLPEFERAMFARKADKVDQLAKRRFLPFTDTDAYRAIKVATEAFVMVNCGVLCGENIFDRNDDYLAKRDLPNVDLQAALDDYLQGADRMLPYLAIIRAKLPEVPIKDKMFDLPPEAANTCYGILQEKLSCPCLVELIWSYWHEEGMLVQTTNSIVRRFQNVRSPRTPDPLANLEIDPLRPLNNLLWGYVQDEQHRLSVVRRDCEYAHHYGMHLEGKAVGGVKPADARSKFLEAFHHLLRLSNVFFKQDDDTTVKADAFPVLNALKEIHLILSEGAHNQFGDLPSTARIEMLMQQWLLARPEFREFLPTRIMVAYPEPWMDRVDAMKKLQGWTDTSVLHFRNLAIFGEQLLLAIRYGNWSDQYDPLSAFNWVRFFRPQIQGYIHAYRAATGVDLAAEVHAAQDKRLDSMPPSVLLKRQMAMQQRRA